MTRLSVGTWGLVAAGLLVVTATALLSTARGEAGASFTGPTGTIVFATNRDDAHWRDAKRPFHYVIYAMNADGGDQRRLTRLPKANDILPAWSQDMQKIAFARFVGRSNYDIYVMNADGSGLHSVAPKPGWDVHPSWSPDGKRLVYDSQGGRRTGDSTMYVMNADGSRPRRLTPTSVGGFDPAWSPDGRQIAFASSRDGNREIYVINANGSHSAKADRNLVEDWTPGWSPDGRWIAFDRGGNGGIYVMRANGAGLRQLTTNALDTQPTWSPDSRWIAFVRASFKPVFNGDIYVMRSDGSQQQRLTQSPAEDGDPAW